MEITGSVREEIIRSHFGLAQRIARSYARRVPSSVRPEDLEGAALLGLTEAAGRFDRRQEGTFIAFASQRIRGAILDELRRHDPLSRRTRAAVKRLESTTSTLRARFGRAPTDSELQTELEWTPEELDRQRCQAAAAIRVEVEDHTHLPCPDIHNSPAQLAAKQQTKARLVAALAELPERDVTILNMYFQEGLSLKEIGDVLGVSESRICQLRGRALSRMRALLTS